MDDLGKKMTKDRSSKALSALRSSKLLCLYQGNKSLSLRETKEFKWGLENWGSGSMSVKQSLVLDAVKGELVNDLGRMGKKIVVSEAKNMAALKSHSETERRRRERINAHFATLRELVPSNEKMDKATLLAEVISKVKQLKKTAKQSSESLHIPTDTDEVEIEKLDKKADDGSFLLRATLCCDYRPDLLSNIRQAINDLPLQFLKCEISTMRGRVKCVFVITTTGEGDSDNAAASIRAALRNILDKVSASAEYGDQLYFPQKRRRVSCFDS
ncbi:hypothetical protein DH2020_042037 [Rehmannia glutinosa]|uniref:BHLH domain-containing protein n=1 Tax=Rehmannia glutinosa TaxID=99300 RepID=A0ABR0UPH6_REHGL